MLSNYIYWKSRQLADLGLISLQVMKLRLKKIKIKSDVHLEPHHMWRITAHLAPRKILPFKRYQRGQHEGVLLLKSAATTLNSTRFLKKLKIELA